MPTDGIELVEEIDAAPFGCLVEHNAQLGGGLAHEPGDERLQTNHEQGELQRPGQCFRSHRLAGPGWSDEQDSPTRRLPMFAKPIPARLLPDETVDLATWLEVQNDVIEPMRGVAQFDQIGEVTARGGEGYSDVLSPTGSSSRLLHGLPNSFGQASMSLPRLGRRHLERDGEELFVVTLGLAAHHRKDLSCIGHGWPTAPYPGFTLANSILAGIAAHDYRLPAAAHRTPP